MNMRCVCEVENRAELTRDTYSSDNNDISRRTFILVPLNKSCSSIACSSQAICLDLSDLLPSLAAADAAAVLEALDGDPSSRGCLRIGCTVSAGGILMFVESIVSCWFISLY